MHHLIPLPNFFSTAKLRLWYPVSRVRIPSHLPSIPRPIATPTPISLRHQPFRTAPPYPHLCATAPSAGGSPDPNGEAPAEIAEDAEDYWKGFLQQPWSAENGFPKNLPPKQKIRALMLPTTMARSKTPPRPLREALRMEKPDWESGRLFRSAPCRTLCRSWSAICHEAQLLLVKPPENA